MEWLTSWWNLIFILPFGLGLMYLGLYTVSGWTFGEADSDAGMDHDLDSDAHIELDADADADADVDADADTDADTDSDSDSAEGHASAFLAALNWIGVGRIPVSLVLMILMLSWGAIGFAAIQAMRGMAVGRNAVIAMTLAAGGSVGIVHVVAAILGPMLFSGTGGPRRRHELLGARGEAMYLIDATFGMACGRDERGELFQVPCRVKQGESAIAKGSAVQLVAYNGKDLMFYVIPADSALTPRRAVAGK
jgi:Protein of unknown function (DUF1449)